MGCLGQGGGALRHPPFLLEKVWVARQVGGRVVALRREGWERGALTSWRAALVRPSTWPPALVASLVGMRRRGSGGQGRMSCVREAICRTSKPPPRSPHTPEVVGPPGALSQLMLLKVRPACGGLNACPCACRRSARAAGAARAYQRISDIRPGPERAEAKGLNSLSTDCGLDLDGYVTVSPCDPPPAVRGGSRRLAGRVPEPAPGRHRGFLKP